MTRLSKFFELKTIIGVGCVYPDKWISFDMVVGQESGVHSP